MMVKRLLQLFAGAEVESGGIIDLWGDGQTGHFFIDDCIEATKKLTRSNWEGPLILDQDDCY